MDKLLIVANWKANNVEPEGWVRQLSGLLNKDVADVEISLAAPFIRLHELTYIINSVGSAQPLSVCSQDLSSFADGAYTGEVTAAMLKNIGVKYSLIGHSERRRYFGETAETVGKKMAQAAENGLISIICAQTREEIPPDINKYPPGKYLIMYEPFEAISTAGTYHAEDPEKINQTISDWQAFLPPGSRFLYGGSVNPENVSKILAADGHRLLSGFVIGHASLDPAEFSSIIDGCLQKAA